MFIKGLKTISHINYTNPLFASQGQVHAGFVKEEGTQP